MQKIGICFMILMILVAYHSIIFAQSYSVLSNSNPLFYYQGTTSSDFLKNYLQNYTQRVPQYHSLSSTYAASGWLNHPPVPVYMPSYPIVLKSGQSSTLAFGVLDPDADHLYVSSNIGATGQDMGGYMTWSFTPNFPGTYLVNTMVYDERGGYALMGSPIFVKPWWSF